MRVRFPSLTPLTSDSTRARPVKRNYMNSNRALIFNTSLRFFIWGISSVGRATALQAVGQGFDSLIFHHFIYRRSLMERQRISTPCYVGSSPTGDAIYPLSSVWTEHLATNQGVGSSNLSVDAIRSVINVQRSFNSRRNK